MLYGGKCKQQRSHEGVESHILSVGRQPDRMTVRNAHDASSFPIPCFHFPTFPLSEIHKSHATKCRMRGQSYCFARLAWYVHSYVPHLACCVTMYSLRCSLMLPTSYAARVSHHTLLCLSANGHLAGQRHPPTVDHCPITLHSRSTSEVKQGHGWANSGSSGQLRSASLLQCDVLSNTDLSATACMEARPAAKSYRREVQTTV
ncbi:hypothetical protein QBC46DRAFT_23024 [Diplogelasinospora grovesii]|uniref:Uncharacterized protein n=1 Tax=Diplogelasinospora grovesii TaxID=303347 RepID=A0AAN6S8G5_9PEZI|nr:hypothetical protein QBC46DRAFT_23024 [Diplogelasinospora grovesii]